MLVIQILGEQLHEAGIPILGVSDNGDGTFRVDFQAGVTQQQRDAAAAIVAAFDSVAAAAAEAEREVVIAASPVGAKAWFAANPNARLIFSMTVSEVAAEIASLVDVSFPAVSAANRTRWKLLLTAIVLVVRIFVKRERLD